VKNTITAEIKNIN